MDVTRTQVIAFRLAGHGLVRRSAPDDDGVARALALGVRTTSATAPAVALAARTDGGGAVDLDALADARRVADVTGARQSPHVVVAADWSVLTAASLPDGDAALASTLKSLQSATGVLDDVAPTEAVRLAVDAAQDALADARLTRGELSAAMTRALPAGLSPYCRGCKVEHVHEVLFRLAGQAGGYVREIGGDALHVSPRAWFGRKGTAPRASGLTTAALHRAQHELLRRLLHAHGPGDVRTLASWLDVPVADAQARWDRFPDALAEVRTPDGRPAWVLADDAEALASAGPELLDGGGKHVRMLPPYDPYLLMADRDVLVPEREAQKLLWRAIGNPGALLVGGEVVAAWRAAASGRWLTVAVTPLPGPHRAVRAKGLEEEAERVAQARGLRLAKVTVD